MPEVKEVRFKIVNSYCKNPAMRKLKGDYCYPLLMTIIEDKDGNVVEVPLSYQKGELATMIRNHLWVERIWDWDSNRQSEQSKKAKLFRDSIDEALNADPKRIREWEKELKKRGNWQEEDVVEGHKD